MTDLRRRNALQLLGGGMAFLAGCSETSDGNGTETDDTGSNDSNDPNDTIEGDLPSYASVLPTTERSTYFYGAIDVETMSTLLEDEGAEAGAEPTDPLVGNPVVVALLCSFGLQQLGSSAGRSAYTDHNETADGEEQFVYADGVYALVGSYDRDGLATALEAAGYTAEREADAYAVYTDARATRSSGSRQACTRTRIPTATSPTSIRSPRLSGRSRRRPVTDRRNTRSTTASTDCFEPARTAGSRAVCTPTPTSSTRTLSRAIGRPTRTACSSPSMPSRGRTASPSTLR